MPKAKSKTKRIPSPHSYIYPGTNVLKNKYEERDLERFREKCLHDVEKAKEILRQEQLPECFDSAYLCYLHHQLFQSAFEWAGNLRTSPFTFADGSTATMPKMKRAEWDKAFLSDKEIPENLQRLEKRIAEKDNLQDLTHKEFISEAVEIFLSLKRIHPFIDGNEQVTELFLENLAKAAGYRLDFSLVTKARMTHACTEAIQHGNPEPIQHMFEDISNPDKICILEEFMNNMKDLGRNVSDRSVMVAKEGVTYMGTYKGINFNGFMLDAYGTYIIGNKGHLTQEQVKTLKTGDNITFTAPKVDIPENIFIPKKRIAPLTNSEFDTKVAETDSVKTAREQVRSLSKIIYGHSKVLDKQMKKVLQNPDLGQHLADHIQHFPSSISSLAGIDFLCFKNQARTNAETHVNQLCTAIMHYAESVKITRHLINQQCFREQKCREIEVENPSKNLKKLLRLSPEAQKEALCQNPILYQELGDFVQKIQKHFLESDLIAIKQNDYETLAQNLGVSEQKAREISNIFQKADQAYTQAFYARRLNRSPNTLSIAS